MATNTSFSNVNEQLAELNVNNRWFFVDTLDSDVKDLNPYGSNLTKDDISLIDNECKNNIWYFLREVVRIKTDDGELNQYTLDLSKLASVYCTINNISNHPVALESQGTMESVACIIIWEMLFKKDYKKIILNDVYEYGEIMYFLIRDIVSELPVYFKNRISCNDETRAIYVDGIQKLFPSQYPLNKRNINNIVNENLNNISIYPNFENMDINTDLIRREDLTTKAYSIAPSYIVSSNSINKTDVDLFVKSSLKWNEIFLDLDIDTFKAYIKRNSLTNFVYIQYKYEELGFTKEYMRDNNLSNPDFSRLNKVDIISAEKSREEAENLRQSEISKLINMEVSAELISHDMDISVDKIVDDDSINLHFNIPRTNPSGGFSYDDLTPEQKEDLLKGTYPKEIIDSLVERLQYYGDISITPPNESAWDIELDQSNDTVTLIGYNGFDTDIVIPYQINGYPVVGVDDYIFENLEIINSVIIPSCLVYIGAEMFANCMGLTNMRIPNSVTTISDKAFIGCDNLKTIYIPDSVTSIGVDAIPNTTTIIVESKNSVAEKYAKDNKIPFKYDTIDIVTLDDSAPVNKTYLELRLDEVLDGGEI